MPNALDWITGIGSGITSFAAPFVDYKTSKERNEANIQMTRETNALNKEIADRNYEQQERLFEYNKALQEQMFEREDTSYQRTAQDMMNAGLNPLSMQGTNGAGEAIAQTAPQNQMQYQQSPAIEKSNVANTMMQAANELFSNMQDLQNGTIQRDKLRQEKKYAEYDHIVNALEQGFYWDSEKNDWSFDDEQFEKYLNSIYSKTEADIAENINRKNQAEHKTTNKIYDTDTKVERTITALYDWLTSGRSEEMWNTLKQKFPLLKLLDQYAKLLVEDKPYDTEVKTGSGHTSYYKNGKEVDINGNPIKK